MTTISVLVNYFCFHSHAVQPEVIRQLSSYSC